MQLGRAPESIVSTVGRRGLRSGGFGRGGLVLWAVIVVGLVGCAGSTGRDYQFRRQR